MCWVGFALWVRCGSDFCALCGFGGFGRVFGRVSAFREALALIWRTSCRGWWLSFVRSGLGRSVGGSAWGVGAALPYFARGC